MSIETNSSDKDFEDDERDKDFNVEDYRDNSDDSSDGTVEKGKDEEKTKDDAEKEYVGPILPGGHRFDKKFLCIKYPGNVENPEKAIETLGGITTISTTVSTRNRRLELHFRPGDGYSKPACGNRHETSAFLLRVRIKKKRVKNIEEAKLNARSKVEILQDMRDDVERNDTAALHPELYPDISYRTKFLDTAEDKIDEESFAKDLLKKVRKWKVDAQDENVETVLKAVPDEWDPDYEKPKGVSNYRERFHQNIIDGKFRDVEKMSPNNPSFDGSLEESVTNSKGSNLIPESQESNSKLKNKMIVKSNTCDGVKKDCKKEDKIKKDILSNIERNKFDDLSQDESYELLKAKVLGRVDTEFRFTSLCDFQYLPITKKFNSKENECIYENLYPTNVPTFDWLLNDVPYFLPPPAFSRMDNVQNYVPKTEPDEILKDTVIGKTRKRRGGFSNYIHFNSEEVPRKPPKGIETAMKVKFIQEPHVQKMVELFEERPIWSKNAIIYITKFSEDQLKILLPVVAYYFMSGPWRIMWVKLGYDPRKDPSARQYQTLDYRLKAMHGLASNVKCKRGYSNYILPYKSTPITRHKTMVLTKIQDRSRKNERRMHENVYIYREGYVPPSRQMFYQYCDVLVDEIQEMLAKLPDPATTGVECHSKMGWLPSGFDDQCREIINRHVRAVLRKRMNIPEDHPTALPRKQKYGARLTTGRCVNRKKKKRNSKESHENSQTVSMDFEERSDEDWEDIDDPDYPIPSSSVSKKVPPLP
ncbi:general transcription factor 3C polypeptide 5 [Orussus abietinus]|uniref:general transcription factor 3C polypeptide 5 n=1 Tax=Orussus abietinus TaxID=222816 RepID=UPI000626A4FA|nr:general transcription factor 3C polypeptide 5 [Orussus abietinus]XP_012278199.1 general transcription factor 3C polypeptide 5 [Orussus abietinus]XP_012278208.1 general transcription factor 3C polypeptide 5 [Orussus abietinus]